jgi:hypothetical protein
VSKQLLDVEEVFGFGVFGCGFTVSEYVEVDLEQFWVLEFECCTFSLVSEGSFYVCDRVVLPDSAFVLVGLGCKHF